MPLFDYTGQLPSGALFEGTLEAQTQEQAAGKLADMGVRVMSLRPAKRAGYVAPLSQDELMLFNEQLAAMVKAQVPLEEGLRQLASDVDSGKLRRLLLDLADDLAAGTPLEQAVEKHRERFPTHYANVVRAGLASGDLGGALYGVTTHLRLKSHLRRMLVELTAYPLLILVAAGLILAFFMHLVMPEIRDIVLDLQNEVGVRMDPSSLWMLKIMDAWPHVEVTVVILVLLLIGLPAAVCAFGGAAARERLIQRVPGVSKVYWSSVLARFTHTSALAAYSGTPLPELVAGSGAASGSPALEAAARRVAERLARGDSLATAVAEERTLPALWCTVVLTSAERGTLPAALAELARAYEQRARDWAGTLRIVLGPVLLLIVGGAIAGLIVMMFSIFSSVLNFNVWF